LSTPRLSPFSFAVLVLVGRHGAGPHDLRRMMESGRVYWDAAPSQWYAEPKRLAASGLLGATATPGRTRERTHYTLTDAGREALAAWVRTPASLPRMQHEQAVRLLAADLVDPEAVLAGLEAFGPAVDDAAEQVRRGLERASELPHRRRLLEVNARYAERLLALQRDWLAEAERALRG
jgi:PadR family transcriptional regulator, regulatory protein AphA